MLFGRAPAFLSPSLTLKSHITVLTFSVNAIVKKKMWEEVCDLSNSKSRHQNQIKFVLMVCVHICIKVKAKLLKAKMGRVYFAFQQEGCTRMRRKLRANSCLKGARAYGHSRPAFSSRVHPSCCPQESSRTHGHSDICGQEPLVLAVIL